MVEITLKLYGRDLLRWILARASFETIFGLQRSNNDNQFMQ